VRIQTRRERKSGMLVEHALPELLYEFMAITCSGGPDIYMVSSVKNDL